MAECGESARPSTREGAAWLPIGEACGYDGLPSLWQPAAGRARLMISFCDLSLQKCSATKGKILKFFKNKLDVVISDMAANTTGNKSLDCIRTNQLCAEVVEFSSKILKPNGVLVSKLFMGDDFLEVKELAKSRFKKVEFFKPESSRNESKETYLHCVTLKTL